MNKLLSLFCLFAFILNFSGCNEIRSKDKMSRLDDTLLSNLKLLRWNSFRQLKFKQTPEYQKEQPDYPFLEKLRVSRVEQSGFNIAEDQESAEVSYAIEFYDTDTIKTRSIFYQQVWVYKEEGRKWLLDSPLPDFKQALKKVGDKPKIKIQYY
jgi:hypothetical protein